MLDLRRKPGEPGAQTNRLTGEKHLRPCPLADLLIMSLPSSPAARATESLFEESITLTVRQGDLDPTRFAVTRLS
jgi:hypothetical protein